jgi:C4-type Zn-finger protein
MSTELPEGELAKYNFDVAHQEISRILSELEQYSENFPADTWVPIAAPYQWLCVQLGYDDEEELDEALHCTLVEFIERLPHFEVDTSNADNIKFRAKVLTAEQTRPRKLTLLLENSKELFTVLTRGPNTRIEIPELEFEMGAPERKEIDTIYNFIAGAVYQLGQYIKDHNPSDDQFDKIYATMQTINAMLDVECPFHIVVHDPCGEVGFKPADKVKVEYLDEPVTAVAAPVEVEA